MKIPELIFVCGCNAAGKSSFIRTRINDLSTFEIIMPDVFKSRTKEVFYSALKSKKNILLETVFNDASFKQLIDDAKNAGYKTSLIALFLNSPNESLNRSIFRSIEQNGLEISKGNVLLNFNESFKNLATYYFYFDWSDFIYTGNTNQNLKTITFKKSILIRYRKNDSQWIGKFADYSFQQDRMNETAFRIIKENDDYELLPDDERSGSFKI